MTKFKIIKIEKKKRCIEVRKFFIIAGKFEREEAGIIILSFAERRDI